MDKETVKEILQRYEAGTASPEEINLVDAWYQSYAEGNSIADLPTDAAKLMQRDWAAIQAQIQKKDGPIDIPSPRPIQSLWRRMLPYAAALLLFFSIGVYYYWNPAVEEPSYKMTSIYGDDVAPGGNRATVTLSDGTVVELDEAQEGIVSSSTGLSYADGQKVIEAAAEVSYVTLSTPRGGQYQITLPDGSKVWLNAESSITYPTSFAGQQRKVELRGEAYFEVAKQHSTQNPQTASRFIVSSAGQEVTVLGTHFNINAYPDEKEIKTTLLEGSVQVSTLHPSQNTILKPNQQAILTGTSLSVKTVYSEDEVAWKNGYFMFNNESLESIMKTIGRWYALEIQYEDPTLKKETFFGTMSKFENSSKVLNMLERTDIVQFEISDNILTIKRKH